MTKFILCVRHYVPKKPLERDLSRAPAGQRLPSMRRARQKPAAMSMLQRSNRKSPRGGAEIFKIKGPPFITHIVTAWRIPQNRLLVLTDAHYRSMVRVGLRGREGAERQSLEIRGQVADATHEAATPSRSVEVILGGVSQPSVEKAGAWSELGSGRPDRAH